MNPGAPNLHPYEQMSLIRSLALALAPAPARSQGRGGREK